MESGFERLKGVFPLVSMAFQEDGAVDYQGFEQIVRFTCGSGANGVGLWGMMAEYYKLSDAERDKLADRFFQITGEYQIPTLVSVTDWCTELAVKRAREYQAKGADFLMLLPPFYYHPTMEAVLQHIQQVTQAVEIPVVVQYAPQSTGMFFEEEIIISLADRYTNLAFKIEHNPQRAFIEKFLTLKPTLKVMSGYAGLDMPELLRIMTHEKLLEVTGLSDQQISYITYDATSDAITALLGGHVDFITSKPAAASQYMESGDMTPVMTVAMERYDGRFADVPTMSEIGEYENFEVPVWRGVVAPGSMPDEAVAYWSETFREISESTEWKEGYLEKNGLTNQFMPWEEATEYMKNYQEECLAGA